MPLNPPVADWRGRRVWIIGASSGIGAATARLLLEKGARVALSARSRQPLEELAAPAPEAALALPLDANRPEEVADALREIVACWGGLDRRCSAPAPKRRCAPCALISRRRGKCCG